MEKIIRASSVIGSRRLSEDRAKTKKQEYLPETDQPVSAAGEFSTIEDRVTITAKEPTVAELGLELEQLKNESVLMRRENADLKEQLASAKSTIAEFQKKYQEQLSDQQKLGFEKGLEEGRLSAKEELDSRLLELKDIGDLLRHSCSEQIDGLQNLAVEIAIAALCRIVEEKIVDSDYVISWVKKVLTVVREESRITIRVNPKQLKALENESESIADLLKGSSFKFVADSRVLVGGCMLETDGGNWDGRLEAQLQRLIDVASKTDKPRTMG